VNDALSSLASLLPVFTAYILAAASPGPSNMAIMGAAMHSGRAHGLALALGVLTGSMTWATLAATGIAVVLATYAYVATAIKIGGGLYLLYLAWTSAKSALAVKPPLAAADQGRAALGVFYRRGLMLHLTNPKAVFAWLAIMSLGVGVEPSPSRVAATVVGCAVLGLCIFGGYALVFSTTPMVRLYQKARRSIEATLALFFGYAGFKLLLSRA
jgi:threonine/homoserine/homoserine lactone efflux protein